ncbi:MAG TPA: NAD(P)/FAD-dependent oxidoreductase [Thermoanaerobaculia bacterium]|nr:NAD(P)/FAD-dependent oxidoreductase [Thermoanaerobaculia bacterium]
MPEPPARLSPLPVVIVGAGPAGLSVAAELNRRGIRPTILEAGPAVGWSWRRHYPFLRLHSTRRDSSLPGLAIPRSAGRYPSRDAFADYLDAYAARLDADLHLETVVRSIERAEGGGWLVECDDGRCFRARHVVVAAGFNRVPVRPAIAGEQTFGGPVLHSTRWSELGEVAGRRVLVVGLGNTGADLVEELSATGAEVSVAVRGPLHLVPVEIAGVNWRTWYRLAPETLYALGRLMPSPLRRRLPLLAASFWSLVHRRGFGDLEARGLRLQRTGELVEHWAARRAPLTAGPFVDRIRRGEVRVLPALAALHPGEAETADGARHAVDAVVLATGYRPALEELLPAEALPADGEWPPEGRPALPGLWFCGCLPELVRIRRAARRVGRGVARDLSIS